MIRISEETAEILWMATGGAMLVLLRSIIDGTRRTWYKLLVGCLLGAVGAVLAGEVMHGSRYVYPVCGASAVMAENIFLGLFKASDEFKEHPFKVFSQLWDIIVPGAGIGKKAETTNSYD